MSTPATVDALRAIASSIDKFCTHLYKTVTENEQKNLICSPISVSMVLSMLTFGASENTEKELRSVLHLSSDDTVNKNGYQFLIDKLNAIKVVQLKLANKIFVASNFDVKSEFKQITETYFRSTSQNVDFKQRAAAADVINSWCAEKTNNRIRSIIQPDDVDSSTALVLVNAVYFKGNWKRQFNTAHTKPKAFHVCKTATKEVPMMEIKARYNFNELPDLNAKFIELPYESNDENDAISMFIILPNEIDGLKNIESKLHEVDFQKLHNAKTFSQIHLQLPKFKVETTIDLNNFLQEMSIKEIFKSTASFRGITDLPLLSVSKVLQKAFIEVNEEGSEAAAVTAVMMVRCCAPMPPIPVIVDRPFFCTIVAVNTGTQLFAARVIDPTVA